LDKDKSVEQIGSQVFKKKEIESINYRKELLTRMQTDLNKQIGGDFSTLPRSEENTPFMAQKKKSSFSPFAKQGDDSVIGSQRSVNKHLDVDDSKNEMGIEDQFNSGVISSGFANNRHVS
jgi:hypothetical protein